MAIQGADPGGEYYFSLNMSAPGVWSAANHANLVNNAPAGALTTYAINVDGTPGTFDKSLGANFATFIQSGRYYVEGSLANTFILMQMFDGSTTQVELRINTAGNLYAARNGTILGTSSNALVPGSGWHYFEWQVTINSSTGSVQLWVDGIQWLNLTGLNTNNSGTAQVNKIRFSGISNGSPGGYWKDMVWLDTVSGANTTHLGDVQVAVLFPNAAGVNQQFSNFGGASQTASVQDGISHTGTWPDGDITYIFDSVSGHISDFAHQAVGSGTIFGIIHASYARSDTGATTFKQYTNSGGTIHTTGAIAINTTYNYFFDVEETDPNTGSAWSQTNFNSATFGVQIP